MKIAIYWALLHQPVTHSQQHEFFTLLHSKLDDLWWCDSTTMYCSNLSSECSTWSLFNILWNRKLMSEDTTTTSRCQIFPEMVICTYIWISAWWSLALCCRGQNFELDMRKPDSCLCYLLYLWPWTRDTLLLVFHIQLNRKSGRFLGSFLPPNVNKSIKLFCCFSRMSLYDVSVHCLGSGPLINSC